MVSIVFKTIQLTTLFFGVVEFSQYTLHLTYVTKVLPSKKKKPSQELVP